MQNNYGANVHSISFMRAVLTTTSSKTGTLGRRFRRGGGNVAVSELQIGGETIRIPAFSGTDDLDGFAPYVPNTERVLGLAERAEVRAISFEMLMPKRRFLKDCWCSQPLKHVVPFVCLLTSHSVNHANR